MSSTNDYPIFSDALYDRPEVPKDLEGFFSYAKGVHETLTQLLGTSTEEMLAEKPREETFETRRLTWDQYGMQLANTAALRGDCVRRQVGAVLMAADHSIISLGYNGGPSKGASCLAGQCPRGRSSKEEAPGNSAYDVGVGTCVALHAEWNVLIRTSWHQFEGATLYVSHTPCHICKVMIAGTKIARVVAPSFEWTL